MRVICRSLKYTTGVVESDASGSLTEGQEYVVLSIETTAKWGTHYRLLVEDGGDFGLFPSTLFEVSDPRLSSRWRCAAEPDGSLSIAPRDWLTPGFWDRYLGDDPGLPMGQPDASAYGTFRLEVQALLAEDEARSSSG